jgi:hypothetical protein
MLLSQSNSMLILMLLSNAAAGDFFVLLVPNVKVSSKGFALSDWNTLFFISGGYLSVESLKKGFRRLCASMYSHKYRM